MTPQSCIDTGTHLSWLQVELESTVSLDNTVRIYLTDNMFMALFLYTAGMDEYTYYSSTTDTDIYILHLL